MVIKWNKDNTFEELDYTAGPFPNGIALDQENERSDSKLQPWDETQFYLTSIPKKPWGFTSYNSPDNLIIQDDSFAWVTNHDHPITDSLKCSSNVNCTLPFSINQLSLQDLSLVASHEFESKNMGVGTVGLPHNGSFWIGSYRSDRLAEAKLVRTDVTAKA